MPEPTMFSRARIRGRARSATSALHMGILSGACEGKGCAVAGKTADWGWGLSPHCWERCVFAVVISEIFPNRIRGAAMSVAVRSLWIACFILTCTFPILNKNLGPAGTFWLYAAICVAGFFFILAKLPETKGKTLEDIERELVD